jgi:glutamate/aspartate transport system substrate-binding protein
MRLGLIMAVAATCILGDAHAQGLTGTLLKIKESGTISVGYRSSSIPFSYLDADQKPIGYAMDLCNRVVEAVKVKLDLPRLDVKLVPVTPGNRIQFMLDGSIDLECGSTSNNLERQKVVAFSLTYFVAANRFASKAAAGYKTLDDLKGKTVVSTVGTANLKQIADLNGQRHLGLNIVAAKDHAEAFRMLATDRASAFVMDDILLYSLVATTTSPADYTISAQALSVEPYGIMLRQADEPFKKLVDDTLTEIYRKGELKAIYAKWFLSPIPPKDTNLNVPMSVQLKRVVDMPTDSGNPADYMTSVYEP